MGRLNVTMKNELISDLEKYSEESGKSVSAVLSESAHFYLESLSLGFRPDQIMKSFRILTILQEMDSVPIPGNLLDYMIKVSYSNSESDLLSRWKERGSIIANILKKYARTLEEFASLIREYRVMIPVNVFDIEFYGDRVHVIMSGAGYSLEASRCTAEGLCGFLSAYGYTIEKSDVSEGFIKVQATSENNEGSSV